MATLDDRGDDGAVPRPTWQSRWKHLDPAGIDGYVRQASSWGPLRPDQVKALLQGLPPPPSGWPMDNCIFDEHYAAWQRFCADARCGAVPAHPTPRELGDWAAAAAVELPAGFVDALASVKKKRRRTPSPIPASQPIQYPPWVPLTSAPSVSIPVQKKRGRPRTEEYFTEKLIEDASQLLWDLASIGQYQPLTQLAKTLARRPNHREKDPATIKRKLAGKLDVKAARLAGC